MAVTNLETGSGRGGQQQRGQGGREDSQLRARVQFLTQENEELAQVTKDLQYVLILGTMVLLELSTSLNVSS